MKKKLQKGILGLLTLVLVASCSTTNDVASNRGIQKRKYTKGYFFDFNNKAGGNEHDKFAKNNGVPTDETTTATEEKSMVRNLDKEVVYVEENNNAATELPQISLETEIKIETPKTTQAAVELVNQNTTIEKVEIKEIETIQSHSKFMHKELKSAKRKITNLNSESSSDGDAILYYLLAIFIPFLAVGLVTNWDVKKVLINILLCCLCGLPGIIHALVVVSKNV